MTIFLKKEVSSLWGDKNSVMKGIHTVSMWYLTWCSGLGQRREVSGTHQSKKRAATWLNWWPIHPSTLTCLINQYARSFVTLIVITRLCNQRFVKTYSSFMCLLLYSFKHYIPLSYYTTLPKRKPVTFVCVSVCFIAFDQLSIPWSTIQ